MLVFLGCADPVDLKDSDSGTAPTETAWPDTALSAPSITLDDDVLSVAWVSWTQSVEADAWVEWQLDGEEVQVTPVAHLAAGAHTQIVLGIPYDTDFTWRVVLADADHTAQSPDAVFRTGLPDDGFPLPEKLVADPTHLDGAYAYLLGSINERANGWGGRGAQFHIFILDRQGRLVWEKTTPRADYTLYVQPSTDGTSILWDQATYWSTYDGGADSVVHRMTLDGTELSTTPLPGMHHSFLELPDGALVWGAADDPDEALMELSPDGTTREVWRCSDTVEDLGGRHTCQSNSLWYEPSDDSLLFSFYTLETVFQIDHVTGDTLRYFGAEDGGWTTFDPTDDQFRWQHGPSWTDEGHLLLSSLRGPEGGDREIVTYEYELDDTSQTLTTVWSAGIGEGVISSTNGEARRLPSGNTLHNMGDAGRIREWTADGSLAWDIDFGEGRLLGHTTLLTDLYAFAPAP